MIGLRDRTSSLVFNAFTPALLFVFLTVGARIHVFYNNAKRGVHLSVRWHRNIVVYGKPLVKWYKRIIMQLLCGRYLINAWYVHQRWDNKHINILQFRERIIDHLLTNNHHIEEMAIEKQIASKKVHIFFTRIRSSHKFVPFFERLYMLRLFTYLSVSWKNVIRSRCTASSHFSGRAIIPSR